MDLTAAPSTLLPVGVFQRKKCKHYGCQSSAIDSRSECTTCYNIHKKGKMKEFRLKQKAEESGGRIFRMTEPTIVSLGGIKQKLLEEGLTFLEDSKMNAAKVVIYAPNQRKIPTDNELPFHSYRVSTFFDDGVYQKHVQKSIGKIKCLRNLTDKEVGEPIQNCQPFDASHFLSKVKNAVLEIVKKKPRFEGAAIEAANDKTTPFQDSLCVASLHIQDSEEAHISAYYPHKDKFGSFVCFFLLSGFSFTFIACKKKGNDSVMAELKGGTQLALSRYNQWKAQICLEDHQKVSTFQAMFCKEATKLKQTQIYVYELQQGQRLCFAAGSYLHASIIPRQQPGIRRSLIVFHDLTPRC